MSTAPRSTWAASDRHNGFQPFVRLDGSSPRFQASIHGRTAECVVFPHDQAARILEEEGFAVEAQPCLGGPCSYMVEAPPRGTPDRRVIRQAISRVLAQLPPRVRSHVKVLDEDSGLVLATTDSVVRAWHEGRPHPALITEMADIPAEMPRVAAYTSPYGDGYAGFGSAWGSWGRPSAAMGGTVAEEALQAPSSDYTALAQEYAPLIAALAEASSDPFRQAALAQERLATLKAAGFSDSHWLVRRTQAILTAAQRRVAIQEEGLTSTREWRGLGKAGIGVGIAAGLGLLALLVVATIRVRG